MNCKSVKDMLLDYVDGSLDNYIKKEVLEHCKKCEDCGNELKELQEAIHYLEDNSKTIKVPKDFMNESKSKETNKKIKGIRRKYTSGILVAAMLTLFVVTAFAIENFNVRDIWRTQSLKESESIEELLEKGYGQKLNLVAEDQNVRITLESVIADDVNTVLLVEIEDLKGEGKYEIGTKEGAITAKGKFNWSRHSSYIIPKRESISQFRYQLYTEEKHVTRQIFTLEPIAEFEETIDFTINELRKLDSEKHQLLNGDWNFQIPVTRYASYIYEINQEMSFDGNIIRFEKIEMAPTMTILTYSYGHRNHNPEHIIQYISGLEIIGNDKIYSLKSYGGGGSVSDSSGLTRVVSSFDSMYFDNPQEIKVRVSEYGVTTKAPGSLDIDLVKPFPQHFEYMGSQITIERVKIGEGEVEIRIADDMKNREYERLVMEPWVNSIGFITRFIGHDGIFMDNKRKQYEVNSEAEKLDMYKYIHSKENKEGIKYYVTSYDIKLESLDQDIFSNSDKDSIDKIPLTVQIKGYHETKNVEEEMKLKLIK